jgi:hypothetical protein
MNHLEKYLFVKMAASYELPRDAKGNLAFDTSKVTERPGSDRKARMPTAMHFLNEKAWPGATAPIANPQDAGSYYDYLKPITAGLPGGTDGYIKRHRELRADKTKSWRDWFKVDDKGRSTQPGLITRIDPWNLHKRNWMFNQGSNNALGLAGPTTEGAAFSDTYKTDDAERRRGIMLLSGQGKDPKFFPEETIHLAQPPFKIHSDKPYAGRPAEAGAKVTKEKHDYIQQNWISPKELAYRKSKPEVYGKHDLSGKHARMAEKTLEKYTIE